MGGFSLILKKGEMMADQLLHGDVTDAIIKSFYHVYNALGYGFLEKVYENALKVSLSKND